MTIIIYVNHTVYLDMMYSYYVMMYNTFNVPSNDVTFEYYCTSTV
jgi:hypothetical protein